MEEAPATLSVEARVIGKHRPINTPWQVALPPELQAPSDTQQFQLRDLIAYIVRQEVRAFRLRQQERRLLHVLSPQQIADAASQGRVVMGGEGETQPEQEVDEEAAVQVALQGFTDGLYLVFLDGQQQHNLADPVHPHLASTLLFIRLVALAGG